MRKNYQVRVDPRSNSNLELTRRLYRNISDIVKRLEEQRASALAVLDIFSPTGDALRFKLTDYCERLVLEDPLCHLPKTEELLWRKTFYDVVATAKKLRKANRWSDMEKARLSNHLSVGVGFYHHLILKLQLEYHLRLDDVLDFAFTQSQRGLSHTERSGNSAKAQNAEAKKCVTRFIHRSLVCLGDLARYKLDIEPDWDPQIAIRYYKMAIAVDDGKSGMPYNQLGTIAGSKNYGLDAVYYYMRSVLCVEPFEGSEGNLKRTIIKNSYSGKEKCLAQSCVARLLSLLQLWDNDSMNINKINQESQLFINEFESCLHLPHLPPIDQTAASNSDSIDTYLSHFLPSDPLNFTPSMLLKILLICLLKLSHFQSRESSNAHHVAAFTLAIFSQLLQLVVARLQDSFSDIPEDSTLPPQVTTNGNRSPMIAVTNGTAARKKTNKSNRSKNLLTKLRRRRDSSDSDEGEAADAAAAADAASVEATLASSSEEASDVSELDSTDDERPTKANGNDVVAAAVAEEKFVEESEEGVKSSGNTHHKRRRLDPVGVLRVLREERLLRVIKVCCDWLRGDKEMIKSCAKGSRVLLKRLVTLLNLLDVDLDGLMDSGGKWDERLEVIKRNSGKEEMRQVVELVPLPEDVDVRGLRMFEEAHKAVDWKYLSKRKLSELEETVIRAMKLLEFGRYLCDVPGSEVVRENGLFDVTGRGDDGEGEDKDRVDGAEPSKGKLMRHMGKLWLKAEVRALESQLHHKLMSPYLVPDHEAFSKYMPIIKHLVFAKKFIVVVPSIVISALDEMKKVSSQAREATRWIENQLRRGSRFLRAQRPHEKLPLPLIKGPKPKDKEAWLYFKIIECCHYLTQQNKASDSEIPVVTLLTGMPDKRMTTFNTEVFAKSAGVNYEHIGAFHAKWKSVKSHG